MEGRTRAANGYLISDSSNVDAVIWVPGGMIVRFHGGAAYLYKGVSRQRAVAAARAKSVGTYINRVIKPQFEALKIT